MAHRKGNKIEKIAIKFYIPLDEAGRKLFLEEYRSSANLNHPNLLASSFYGEWNRRPYIGMPYCSEGASSKYVGNLTPCEKNEAIIWRFIRDTAAGLQFLHENEELVHQDIKPDNILINSDGNFLIMDFGISRKARATLRSQSKRSNSAGGAIAYMAPERFTSRPSVIFASDIWSLGASIYELAAGELPFNGMGGGLLNAGAEMPELDKRWSKDLAIVINACLAKETWDRKRACEIREYAEWVIGGRKGKNPWDSITTPEPTAPRRRAWNSAKTGVLAICALSIIFVLWFSFLRKTPEIRLAETQYPQYMTVVKQCEDSIASGGNANTVALIMAKDLMRRIEDMESSYSNLMPNKYNKSTSMWAELTPKLQEASEAWANMAKMQYDVSGDLDLSLQYAQTALSLYDGYEAKGIYNNLCSRVGYMMITDVEFANSTDMDFTRVLKASTVKYLCPRIKYNGLCSDKETVKVDIKIILPNGSMDRGVGSPQGYTYSADVVVQQRNNQLCTLSGWGNESGGYYTAGTYFLEIWYKGEKIYTKRFNLI